MGTSEKIYQDRMKEILSLFGKCEEDTKKQIEPVVLPFTRTRWRKCDTLGIFIGICVLLLLVGWLIIIFKSKEENITSAAIFYVLPVFIGIISVFALYVYRFLGNLANVEEAKDRELLRKMAWEMCLYELDRQRNSDKIVSFSDSEPSASDKQEKKPEELDMKTYFLLALCIAKQGNSAEDLENLLADTQKGYEAFQKLIEKFAKA